MRFTPLGISKTEKRRGHDDVLTSTMILFSFIWTIAVHVNTVSVEINPVKWPDEEEL